MIAKTGKFYNVTIEHKTVDAAGETIKSLTRYLVIADTPALAETKAVRKAKEDGSSFSIVAVSKANYATVYINEAHDGGISSFYRVKMVQRPSLSDTKVELDGDGRRVGKALYYLFEASTPESAQAIARATLKLKLIGKDTPNVLRTKIKKMCE